ncbi:MAG: c-type cytochrome [Paracoccaceae bacterium]
MRRLLLLAVLACAGMLDGAAEAQDVAAGEEIYQGVCRNCHGPTAKGMASYPRLAGQSAAYLSSRLETYRAGETVSYNSALMIPHARELSDADIDDVVAYITTTFE